MKEMFRWLGVGAVVALLSACGSGVKAWEAASSGRYQKLQERDSLLGVTVPVLRAPGLERVWGAPKISVDGEGGYCLTYADPKQPFMRLMVHGMVKPMPALGSAPPKLSGEEMVNDELTGYEREQAWREVTVLGEKVRWYQESTSGGADGAYFSTEGFKRKAADGRVGYYRLVAEEGDEGEAAERWFGSVGF